MINAPQDPRDLVLTVIRFVPKTSEMMDSSAERLSMEEEEDIPGNSKTD